MGVEEGSGCVERWISRRSYIEISEDIPIGGCRWSPLVLRLCPGGAMRH